MGNYEIFCDAGPRTNIGNSISGWVQPVGVIASCAAETFPGRYVTIRVYVLRSSLKSIPTCQTTPILPTAATASWASASQGQCPHLPNRISVGGSRGSRQSPSLTPHKITTKGPDWRPQEPPLTRLQPPWPDRRPSSRKCVYAPRLRAWFMVRVSRGCVRSSSRFEQDDQVGR